MSEETRHYLAAAALLTAGGLATGTAWACRREGHYRRSGIESGIWAAVALLFVGLAWVELLRPGRWLAPTVRQFARDHHLYGGAHRPLQLITTVAVAAAAVALLLNGLFSARDAFKQYRLAIGCGTVAAAYGVIRFVSLDEVDAWNLARPWTRTEIALVTAGLASAAAVIRLRRFRE